MKGAKPKPTVLKMLRGNPGKRPLPVHEPKALPLTEECPLELTDPVAIEEWTRTVAPAIRIGIVAGTDRAFAIAHCALWATWRAQLVDAAEAEAARDKGWWQARNAPNKTFLLLARVDSELGFTPSSRTRVQVAPKDHDQTQDKWAGIL